MGLLSLGELIKTLKEKNKIYIPLYQRNYRWSADDSKKLMNDILKNCCEEKNHVLGMITVCETECKTGYQILDGQQRLITLSLIVKALEKINTGAWINLEFERDPGFDNEKEKPRHDYIYEGKDNKTVDVERMKINYKAIEEILKKELDLSNKEKTFKENVFEKMLKHLKILLHVTTREPIDEFLNMNFNKTPFCAADKIKAYMIMDASNEDDSQQVTVSKIMNLWRKLESVIYQLKDSVLQNTDLLENDMYQLIKKNYKHIEKNRMEVLFENRYYEKETLNCKSYYEVTSEQSALQKEYEVLKRYYDIMRNLMEELSVTDRDGRKYPNYTAYSAFNLLCAKKPEVKFFGLFQSDDNVQNVLYKQFNLTNEVYNQIKPKSTDQMNKQLINQFMEAMLVTENTTDNNNSRIGKIRTSNAMGGLENFDSYKILFDEQFNKFVEMIEKGKNSSLALTKPNEQTFTMKMLFADEKVRKIRIPQIQRDYVMGASGEYLENYLQKIYQGDKKCQYACWKKENENNAKSTVTVPTNNIEWNISFEENKLRDLCGDELFNLPKQEEEWHSERKRKYEIIRRYVDNIRDDNCTFKGNEITDFRRTKNPVYKNWEKLYSEIVKKMYDYVNEAANFEFSEVKPDYRMNTSCIMGHLDEEGTFWVYDGQQRLTTSVVLLAYLLRKEKSEEKDTYRSLLRKFAFEGREGANQMLNAISSLERDVNIEEMKNYIDDNTSYAIYRFWELLNASNEKKENIWEKISELHSVFIWEGMDFELVLMDKVSDAEQIFIEMNEGVKLENEEKYKAQLSHILKKIKYDKRMEFLRKVDNEWLNKWKNESLEVKWIQYCITMAYHEIYGYTERRKLDDLSGLNKDVLEVAKSALDYFGSSDAESKYIEEINYESIKNVWLKTIPDECYSKYTFVLKTVKTLEFYFEKAEFEHLLEAYNRFINEDNKKMELCFESIQSLRKHNRIIVEENMNPNTIPNTILLNRKNRYKLENIKKWEKWGYRPYETFSKTCYDLEKKSMKPVKSADIQWDKDVELGKLTYEYLFEQMTKDEIISNIRYMCYANKPMDKELTIEVKEQKVLNQISEIYENYEKSTNSTAGTDFNLHETETGANKLLDKIMKDYKNYKESGALNNRVKFKIKIEISKWNDWISNLQQNDKANSEVFKNYQEAIEALAKEKGLFYFEHKKDSPNNTYDLWELMEKVGITNAKETDLEKLKSEDLKNEDLLTLYKNCDKRVEDAIGNYIVEKCKNEGNKELFDFVIWYSNKKNEEIDSDILKKMTEELVDSNESNVEKNLEDWKMLFKGEGETDTLKKLELSESLGK